MQTAIRSGLVILAMGIAAIAAAALPAPLHAESPNHINMGVLIERNQSDVRFLDVAISNLPINDAEGNPDAMRAQVIGLFREALQHDYHANLWYMQGRYAAAYKEMQKSQNFLQQAYEKVLRRYNDATMALLDAASPIALRTRDASAGHLLRSAFRDLTHARNFHMRGFNINPRYHTNQLHYYRSGIVRARRARKYGLLAMIEARLPLEERDQYQLVTYDDIRTGARADDPKMNDYNRVETALRNMISRNLIPAEVGTRNLAVPIKLMLLEIHQDSHGRMIEDRASVWLTETDQLDRSRFYTDYSLPKRNLENRNVVPAADSDPVELQDASVDEAPDANANEGANDDAAKPQGYLDAQPPAVQPAAVQASVAQPSETTIASPAVSVSETRETAGQESMGAAGQASDEIFEFAREAQGELEEDEEDSYF